MIPKQRSPQLIPPHHGRYRELQSYQMAEIVYDATVVFFDRYFPKRTHTHDQMVQAARSGKQNHVWGVNSRCFIPGSGLFQT